MTKSPCAGPLRPALGVAFSRHHPDEPLTQLGLVVLDFACDRLAEQ
jgi:hypothetical protein